MDSTQDEIGASAILSAQLDEELGGGPMQVKMIFLAFFRLSSSPPCPPCFSSLNALPQCSILSLPHAASVLGFRPLLCLQVAGAPITTQVFFSPSTPPLYFPG